MFCFHLPCFHIHYNFCSKNYLLLIYWWKIFLIFLIILSLIALFLFFSLKIFFILLIAFPYISFFSLKTYFTPLIMLSFFYLSFLNSFFLDSKRVLSAPKIQFKLFSLFNSCLSCSILIVIRKKNSKNKIFSYFF